MIDPPIEDVLKQAGNRFTLVVLAARRARQINAYFNQLGEGIGTYAPPQVQSLSRKPLSISLEEIADGKVDVDIVTVDGGVVGQHDSDSPALIDQNDAFEGDIVLGQTVPQDDLGIVIVIEGNREEFAVVTDTEAERRGPIGVGKVDGYVCLVTASAEFVAVEGERWISTRNCIATDRHAHNDDPKERETIH